MLCDDIVVLPPEPVADRVSEGLRMHKVRSELRVCLQLDEVPYGWLYGGHLVLFDWTVSGDFRNAPCATSHNVLRNQSAYLKQIFNYSVASTITSPYASTQCKHYQGSKHFAEFCVSCILVKGLHNHFQPSRSIQEACTIPGQEGRGVVRPCNDPVQRCGGGATNE